MIKNAVIIGFAIALLGLNIYVCTRFGFLVAQVSELRTDLEELRKTTHQEISVLQLKTASTATTSKSAQKTLLEEVEKARKTADMAVGQAKVEAVQRYEELSRKFNSEVNKQQKKLEQSDQQIKTELTAVKESATTTDAKVNEVHSEVTNVKTQLLAERAALDKQSSELKRVVGELGVQSDRIATNHKELQALKALGERNYYEFTLERGKDTIKVYDIRLALKKADPKKGKFTVELVTADRRFQKKDRNLNEPIQFYVNKTRQPYELVVNELYELVVNEIDSNKASGYLATPKIEVVRR